MQPPLGKVLEAPRYLGKVQDGAGEEKSSTPGWELLLLPGQAGLRAGSLRVGWAAVTSLLLSSILRGCAAIFTHRKAVFGVCRGGTALEGRERRRMEGG